MSPPLDPPEGDNVVTIAFSGVARSSMKIKNSPFRLLVFDWDGTIMDSFSSITASTLRGFEDFGLEAPPVARIQDSIGLNREKSLERLFSGYETAERERVLRRIRYHWMGTYRDRVTLIEGAREVLEGLAEQQDNLLAVATGKSRHGLDHDLAETGLGKLFLATRTADDAASKPHPQMLFDLMDELGATPRQTLMIGDTTYDLDMANNAGCAGLGVATGFHTRAALDACVPLDVIESLAALPAWLENRNQLEARKS